MTSTQRNEKMEDRLMMAASYLEIAKDNSVMLRGNLHPYCEVESEEINEKELRKKPSFFKRLYYTFF